MGKISVVINTLNEEKNIVRVISSVTNFASEIIVVDMHSDDSTGEIAKGLGAKVYEYRRLGYVEPARNYAIGKAGCEWILILDADEEITQNLGDKLNRISTDAKSDDFYRLPRKNIIFGKWIKHSRWWPDYNIRFFKNGFVSWNEIIHSVPSTKGKGGDLEADENNAIVHHHYDTIEQYVDRLNRYSTFNAKLLVKGGYKFNWKDLISEPVSEFLSRYFQGEGYKDGIHGLALCLLQAFSEIVTYLKVWQIKGFENQEVPLKMINGEVNKAEKEINYWKADALNKNTGSMFYRVKRKLKLP